MRVEVVDLWRYPVKSMQGEPCRGVALEPRGVAGDRVYAVQDLNGKLGSGKNTRRFRKIDGLLGFRAVLEQGIAHIQFPSGQTLGSDDVRIDRLLSDVLGQTVSLARESEVPHMDAGPVHIISTGSLEALQRGVAEGAGDARRFRPNIVLSMPGDRPEQKLIGKRVRIGEAQLEIVDATERCGMVEFPQGDLEASTKLLRHLSEHWNLCFGIYAKVSVPGVIRVGDIMEVL